MLLFDAALNVPASEPKGKLFRWRKLRERLRSYGLEGFDRSRGTLLG
jgi:hypothetical protein